MELLFNEKRNLLLSTPQLLGLTRAGVHSLTGFSSTHPIQPKFKLSYDRRSVGHLILMSGSHLELMTRFFFCIDNCGVSWCGAPSLTRSRVCTFQFLPDNTSAAFLRSESHGTHEHILFSPFLRLSQPGGPGYCIYFFQEQGSPVIPPGIWFNPSLHTEYLMRHGPHRKHCVQKYVFFFSCFQHRNSRTFPIESLAHDSGRTLVCAEYGYPKWSPNTNS
jgi:hypothetical protein